MRTLIKSGPNGEHIEVTYDEHNPQDRKQAWKTFWEISEEEYDRQEAERRKASEEFKKKYPLLHNLVWADGEMYYVDDHGNRLDDISTVKHLGEIKDQVAKCFSDVAPKESILVNGLEMDRFSLLGQELEKTKFQNNAKDFILKDSVE